MRKLFFVIVFVLFFSLPAIGKAMAASNEAYLAIEVNTIGADGNFAFFIRPDYFNPMEYYNFTIQTRNNYGSYTQTIPNPAVNHYLSNLHQKDWELISSNCSSNNANDSFVKTLDGIKINMAENSIGTCVYNFQIIEKKRRPVIIVPGIMGSYLNRASDNKELWPNIDEMIWPGEDEFLYELEMDQNGISKNNIKAGDIIRKAVVFDVYDGLIKELENAGYIKDTDLFVLPYDWRQDIAVSAVALKNKIEEIGADQIDIVAHSMGGLVLKKYMYDNGTEKIGKFVDLATPHLGAPKAAKALLFGDDMGFKFGGYLFMNQSTLKMIAKNMPALYQLLPSENYFNPYDSDYKNYLYIHSYLFNTYPLPPAILDYNDSMDYLALTGGNELLLGMNGDLHGQINGLGYRNSFNIVGCGLATIGKIWFNGKDKKGKDKYDISYINGDGTVPLHSATYFSDPVNYFRAEHGSFSSAGGVKELVASILNGEDNGEYESDFCERSLSDNDCSFSGFQVSFHSPIKLNISTPGGRHLGPDADGNIVNDIAEASYDILGDNKFAFVPAGAEYFISGQAEGAGEFDMRVKKIVDGQYMETALFYNLPLAGPDSEVKAGIREDGVLSDLQYDAEGDGIFETTIMPSSILAADEQDDKTPPITEAALTGEETGDSSYASAVEIELLADDEDGTGVLDIYYELDGNGWQKYAGVINVIANGSHKLEYYAVDKAGNEEEIKTVDFSIMSLGADSLLARINDLYDQGEIYRPAVKNYFNAQLNMAIKKQEEMAETIVKWRERLEKEAAKCDQKKHPALCQNILKELNRIVNAIEEAGNKIIKQKYAEMLKMLEMYKTKNWLSQSAYDIIKTGLINLRDK